MKWVDSLLGRNRPRAAQLDALFGLPNAAITLETAAGFKPIGSGAVCFRAAEGAAAVQTQADIVELLNSDADGPDVEKTVDSFGFTWLVTRQDDMSLLCNDLHAINTSLEEQGFGPGLAVLDGVVRRPRRPEGRAGLPLQAGHLLSVRAQGRAGARQPARDPDP